MLVKDRKLKKLMKDSLAKVSLIETSSVLTRSRKKYSNGEEAPEKYCLLKMDNDDVVMDDPLHSSNKTKQIEAKESPRKRLRS